MRKTLLVFALVLFCYCSMLIAQRHCSSTEHLIYQLQTIPDFKQKRAAIEEQTQRMAAPTPRLRGQSPILIPVVVNLVYSMEAEKGVIQNVV